MTQSVSRPIQILCVDDEPDILELVSERLASLEVQIVRASSGPEALSILRASGERVALVLADFAMPQMDGFVLRKTMLAEGFNPPFILMSGHITREAALEAVSLKVSGFLAKPFTSADLLETVTRESKDKIQSIRDEDEMLAGFVAEAENLVDEMEGLILGLEDNLSDSASIDRVFACAHTIKGTSGFFKPDSVHRFTHRYEDYLSTFKKTPGSLTSEGCGVLLKGLDTIKELVAALAIGKGSTRTLEEMVAIFEQVATPVPAAAVEVAAKEGGTPSKKSATSDELRVSVALLNRFMEKSGELTVLRNMVNKSVRAIEAQYPANPNLVVLSELLSEMHKVNGFIQEQVTDLRKVSLKQVFKPLTRTLRDLCVSLKKKMSLEFEGDELRVDHTLAETLNRCLIHIVRNAADHGLETPDQRQAAGKPPQGKIWISAVENAERVTIRIKDDGRGIDTARVKKKAIEKGLVSAEKAEHLSDSQIQMLIFEPGFSTAEQVTDVSGRGVGTDMVKGTVLALGGSIELHSELGKGSEFVLHLPVPKSVLIVSSLLVVVRGETFAIPNEDVIRVINLNTESECARVRSVGNAIVYDEQGELLPVVDLAALLGKGELTGGFLICVKSKNHRFCLRVGEVLDIEDTVVKRIGSWFDTLDLYAGGTFLADGRVGLVFDVEKISAALNLDQEMEAAQEVGASAEIAEQRSVLVFDLDSESGYGVLQEKIFRLEEVSRSSVSVVGAQPVVIYRGQTMPLIPVEAKTLDHDALSYSVLVHENQGRFFGFVVRKIRDFVTLHADDPAFVMQEGAREARIVNGETITLLRLDQLLSEWQAA